MDYQTIIPVVAIFFVFGAPIIAWIVSRVLAHNEYMAMISHGITPPPDPRAWRRAQRAGWVPPGAPGNQWGPPPPPAGFTGPPPTAPNAYGDYYHAYAQRRLGKGIMVAMVGLAFYLALGFTWGNHGFGGASLPGLVIMFVGLAQIISAVLAGATVGGPSAPPAGWTPNARSAPFGPAATPPPPPPPPAGAPPYGWRPGDVTPIEKPAGPPDPR